MAFVTNAWQKAGGAERGLYRLLKELDRERFDPVVFTLFSARGNPTFAASARVLSIPLRSFCLTPKRDLRFPKECVRFVMELRRGRYDAVHGRGDRGIGVIAGRLVGIPVRVRSIHNTDRFGWRAGDLLQMLGLRWFATKVVAVSGAVAEVVRTSWRVPEDKIEVILNGVEDYCAPGGSSPAHSSSSTRSRPRRVVTVGRLVPVKGLDRLLEAMAILTERVDDVEMQIIGDGPLRCQLQRQVDRLGLTDAVRFVGQVEDAFPYLVDADVFVIASRSEGLGVAAIEAMAASLPVVAAAVGGLPEVVVHGETGLLINPCACGSIGGDPELDPAAVADALERLLVDGQLARSMGRAGRIRYEKTFTSNRFVRQYEALYRGDPLV